MLRSILNYQKDRRARKRGREEARRAGKTDSPSHQAGPLEKAFFSHQGRLVHKWHHYLPIYDRYFAPYRGKPVRFLEIGVAEGGSLQLWRDYFGPEAAIFGIDIEPRCAQFDGEHGNIRIGSQTDPDFVRAVISEMGGVDIVLDDGSHHAHHMRPTMELIFPLLSEGGIYLVEDLHCAYWPRWGGGYGKRANFFATVRTIIDDMHHWYHGRGVRISALQDRVSGVHVHDSLVILEKAVVEHPKVSVRPAPCGP